MRRVNPETLTDYPELPDPQSSSLTFGRRSTNPVQNKRRNSTLGNILASIREALAREQERLRTKTTPDQQYHSAIAEHMERIQDQGQSAQTRTQQDMLWEDVKEAKESISPALEARESFEIDKNNMGTRSHRGSPTWGWPGLGSFPQRLEDPVKRGIISKSEKFDILEPRFEAATFEAINNAAESNHMVGPASACGPDPKNEIGSPLVLSVNEIKNMKDNTQREFEKQQA